MTAVLRFAPSPNGALHLGHALSALTGFDLARRLGGSFLVRIEDIDTVRCRPEFAAAALADLRWLGLSWQEPVLRQSEHFDAYRSAATQLQRMGLLYPCFATRAELSAASRGTSLPTDPDGASLYPGLYRDYPAADAARRIAAGEPYALRIDIRRAIAVANGRHPGKPLTFVEHCGGGCPDRLDIAGGTMVQAHPEDWGDAVIVRKDVPASYHLAVVVDDARQGITLVTRGMDLYRATDLHRLLQVLLGLPEPAYCHHRLLLDAAGRKLSKSAADTSLASLRARGWTPAEVRSAVGFRPNDG